VLAKVSAVTATLHGVFPVLLDDRTSTLSVATADPDNDVALHEIRLAAGVRDVQPVVARPAAVRAAIAYHYRNDSTAFHALVRPLSNVDEVLHNSLFEYLSLRAYRAEAQQKMMMMPYCGIFWDDELDLRGLMHMSDEDRRYAFRLFEIRLSIWKGTPLAEDDEQIWNEALTRVPAFALFRRLSVSEDDLRKQDECERDMASDLHAMWSRADEVKFVKNEQGESRFEATIDLTKGERPARTSTGVSWWTRLWRRT
jgi:hypothetical protein